MIKEMLEGGKRVAYGARAVTKGGPQSMPEPVFPGGALLGCSVGLVNLPRIKGNHNAMHSGIEAAEAAHAAIAAGRSGDTLSAYATALKEGPVGQDLHKVRNVAPLSGRYGLLGGLGLGGLDMWAQTLLRMSPFGTLGHCKSDAQSTAEASKFAPIEYPKPDGKISFDRLTNVSFAMTNHEESQPAHLTLKDGQTPYSADLARYAGISSRYCPAGVYEFVKNDDGTDRFVINFQNCVHCKTCDIKDPAQNIVWTVPQGGDGAELSKHVVTTAPGPARDHCRARPRGLGSNPSDFGGGHRCALRSIPWRWPPLWQFRSRGMRKTSIPSPDPIWPRPLRSAPVTSTRLPTTFCGRSMKIPATSS